MVDRKLLDSGLIDAKMSTPSKTLASTIREARSILAGTPIPAPAKVRIAAANDRLTSAINNYRARAIGDRTLGQVTDACRVVLKEEDPFRTE